MKEDPMNPSHPLFEIETEGDTVVVTPTTNLGEFDYQELVEEADELLKLLEGTADKRNVVVDFHRTDYFGSTALGFLLKLRKITSGRQGEMALCGVSEHEREILASTKLDSLWPIVESREQALESVKK